ncbi:MAG TPA: cation transporter, partial [Thauera aminoaromatica]|nr:cation transporter [Thauera aminoaromatica]
MHTHHGHQHDHHAHNEHDHQHGGPAHGHAYPHQAGHAHPPHHAHDHSASRFLPLALVLTLGFAAVEAIAGWWSGSLALLGDAGHMLTDAASLGLAALAARIALRPA